MTDAPKSSQPFKTIAAAVENINLEKRTLTAIDENGITHPMKWASGYLDEKLGKLKEGYYREFTCEIQGEDLRITSVKYLESPDWVKARFKGKGGGGGGRNYPPRNEKPILFESVFKSCCDRVRDTDFPDMGFKDRMDAIWTVAKVIGQDMAKESGA